MTRKISVLTSINLPDGNRCVDLFARPDGTFGFEEYRRDIEDARGWFAVGFFGDLTFDNEDDALRAAQSRIPWLKDAMTGR